MKLMLIESDNNPNHQEDHRCYYRIPSLFGGVVPQKKRTPAAAWNAVAPLGNVQEAIGERQPVLIQRIEESGRDFDSDSVHS